MDKKWFTSMIRVMDRENYYKEYARYQQRVAEFNNRVTENECREVAKEILALG